MSVMASSKHVMSFWSPRSWNDGRSTCPQADLPEPGIEAALHNGKQVLLSWTRVGSYAPIDPPYGPVGSLLKPAVTFRQ